MLIRLATKSDESVVLELLEQLLEEARRTEGKEYKREIRPERGLVFNEVISRKDTFVFVADEEGRGLGLATLYLLPIIRHGWQQGHVEDFVIDSTVRGKGIGTQIFDAVKDFCRKREVRVIKLTSGLGLTGAHRFYERHGGKYTEKMYRFDL